MPAQMKDKYADTKPYGDWLKAQVATLADLIESVPEHLLRTPPIHSHNISQDSSSVSSSQDEAISEADSLSSSQQGAQVGVGAHSSRHSNGNSNGHNGKSNGNNGHSNGHAGTLIPCIMASAYLWNPSLLLQRWCQPEQQQGEASGWGGGYLPPAAIGMQ